MNYQLMQLISSQKNCIFLIIHNHSSKENNASYFIFTQQLKSREGSPMVAVSQCVKLTNNMMLSLSLLRASVVLPLGC